jgi:uncharacterized glyoxalase superfamily protein PhnB
MKASTTAFGLRVADVRAAAEFYEDIGFQYVMAVPDDNGDWILCLLRLGSVSVLLGPLDHSRFPRTSSEHRIWSDAREHGTKIDLTVPELLATHDACVRVGCEITLEPTQEVWGLRVFTCVDPFGYEWRFTQRKDRLSADPRDSSRVLTGGFDALVEERRAGSDGRELLRAPRG